MNKNFLRFTKINKKIIFEKKNKKIALIIDRGRMGSAIYSTLLSGSLNKKYNCNINVYTSNNNSDIIKLYKSFGIKKIISSSFFSSLLKNFFSLINSILITLLSIKIFFFKNFEWFIKNFKYEGILIGDLIYDTYIRKKHRFINPKKDIYFLFIICATIYKINKILSFLNKKKIKFIIVSTNTFANYDSLFIRIGLKKKINVLEMLHSNDYVGILKYNNKKLKYGIRNIKNDENQKKLLFKLKKNTNYLNKFYKKRLNNKVQLKYTNNFDIKHANPNNLIISKNQFLKKFNLESEKFRKLVLFAPHAFSDAPHGAGYDLIFNDFYTFFTETCNQIIKNNNNQILWIIRPHPSSDLYGEENIIENYLIKKNLEKNIVLCPKYISTRNLIEICDTVITCKGTIGLEFAAFGKKPITCSYPPYSGFKISEDATSKKKFFKIINNIHLNNFKLPDRKKILAQKILYFLETELSAKKLKQSKNLKDILININQNKSDSYWKELRHRIIKNRWFINDNLYKSLIKII